VFIFNKTSPPYPLSKLIYRQRRGISYLERGINIERGLRPLSLTHSPFYIFRLRKGYKIQWDCRASPTAVGDGSQ